MWKHSNLPVEKHGLAPYLATFKLREARDVKETTKQILNDTFDYKAEGELLKSMVDWRHKLARHGGPLPKKLLDTYPSEKKYQKHLEERFNLFFDQPRKIIIRKPGQKHLKVQDSSESEGEENGEGKA